MRLVLNTHTNKTKENVRQSVAHTITEKKSNTPSFYFTDNRPEAIVQRKLQENINSKSRISHLNTLQNPSNNEVVQRVPFIAMDGAQLDTDNLTIAELSNHLSSELEDGQKEIVRGAISRRTIQSAGAIPESRATGPLLVVLNRNGVSFEEFTLGLSGEAQAAAIEYMDSRDVRTQEADLTMLRSLSAMSILHQDGFFDQMLDGPEPGEEMEERHNGLIAIARLADNKRNEILDAYGLDNEERTAIEHYTNAHTNALMIQSFGSARMGWQILSSAIDKLPSTGELGMEHSGFRIPRPGEGGDIEALGEGARIRHGHDTMDQGQKHFMSVATTYNVHTTQDRVAGSGGIIGVQGTSGRYINPFGVQGTMTDGAEVLYPPEIESIYTGTQDEDETRVALHSIVEETGRDDLPDEVYEDNNYQQILNPYELAEDDEIDDLPEQEQIHEEVIIEPQDTNAVGYSYTTPYGSTMRRRHAPTPNTEE